MHVRFTGKIALVIALACFTGCDSGSSDSSLQFANCGDPRANLLCLQSCSLGCANNRCEISNIAQNEQILLVFSKPVDPLTVNTSTIQLRTASGEPPVGDFLVNGAVVEFVPQVLVVGGQSFFGFRAGETYTMTLPGGSNTLNSVRSTGGDVFAQTITCSLAVTRGVVDLNRAPPRATMVLPQTAANVPLGTSIVLEFNEILDVTPFLNATPGNEPVLFAARRTREVPGGGRQCNPNSLSVPLGGTPRLENDPARGITVLTYQPPAALQGNICVEVTVSDRVRDLAGNPAQPQVFQFTTVEVPLREDFREETFFGDVKLDRTTSSGTWGGGTGRFGSIGGDGRHGAFDYTLFPFDAATNAYTITTDNTVIPGSHALMGQEILIQDGRFYFDKMTLPAGVRIRFVGNVPPIITVSGAIELNGIVDIAGRSTPLFAPTTLQNAGQAGGLPGVYGGAGGKGGDRILTAGASAVHQGENGRDCRVDGGHAYSSLTLGTGGRGSSVYPASGLGTALLFTPVPPSTIAYSPTASAGGAGGGFTQAGGLGRVVSNNQGVGSKGAGIASSGTSNTLTDNARAAVPPTSPAWTVNQLVGLRVEILSGTGSGQARAITSNTASSFTVSPDWTTIPDATSVYNLFFGPPAAAGLQFNLFPIPPGARSSTHFLVGGSGGGGGASQSALCLNLTIGWAPGSGGGGGGGAVALRAGDSLRITPLAQVLCNGGGAASATGGAVSGAQPTPGGAGAGGSVVMQTGRFQEVLGQIDVRGGTGGLLDRSQGTTPPSGAAVRVEGGAGSPGFVRLEVPSAPSVSMLPNVLPAAVADNVGTLGETDDLVAFRSQHYSTNQAFGPEYSHYEIQAIINGNPVTFSDNPAISTLVARFDRSAPIEALFQAVTIDLVTGLPAATSPVLPWRRGVRSGSEPSLADDALNGFRFMIVWDRRVAAQVEIDNVKVVYRY